MYQSLRNVGKPFGIHFGNMKMLYNSRIALEASEFARDQSEEIYEKFHHKIFEAYFTDCKDISQISVILDIAKTLGLDVEKLTVALKQGTYRQRLELVNQEAEQSGISGAPTFIFNDQYCISGAQPLENFVKLVQNIQKNKKK